MIRKGKVGGGKMFLSFWVDGKRERERSPFYTASLTVLGKEVVS